MTEKRLHSLSSNFHTPRTSIPEAKYPHINIDPQYDAIKTLKIDEELTHDENRYHKKIRAICQSTTFDFIANYESATSDVKEFKKMFKKLGPGGLDVNGFGCANLSNVEVFLLILETFRLDASFGTEFLIHNSLAMRTIFDLGTKEQHHKYLTKMSSYEKIGCFALTEPGIGSDAASLLTTATRVEGGWLLNGEKRWIGGGLTADIIIVWARNEETKKINGFLVEGKSSGITASKIENKIALRIVQNANLRFTNCFVTDENRLQAEDFTGSTAKSLQNSRALVVFACSGILLGAYERAISYCTQRFQFDKTLTSFQLIQSKLMAVLGNLQSVILTSLHIAKLLDRKTADMKQISLAKAYCTQTLRKSVAICREVCGGNGIIYDYGVAISFLDAEALFTYEGTYDINTLLAGRLVFGKNAIR